MKVILENPMIDIHVVDKNTGVNSFWLAAFYGHGEVMNLLANAGIDILNKHKKTKYNALHTVCDKKFSHIVQQLVDSRYPLDEKKHGGLTALITSCIDDDEHISKILIKGGANLNVVTDKSSSALSEAVMNNNKKLTWLLLT
jgi:ankyrin repeat protein